ncbi:hypothetical protein DMENIID0001_066540 [Sergentomyia squamirostris]
MQLESGRKSNGVSEKNSGTMFPDLVTEKVETYYVPASPFESRIEKPKTPARKDRCEKEEHHRQIQECVEKNT